MDGMEFVLEWLWSVCFERLMRVTYAVHDCIEDQEV